MDHRIMRDEFKHRYFQICVFISIPLLLFFGIDDWKSGRAYEAFFTFLLGYIFIGFAIYATRGRKADRIMRIGMVLMAVFFLYLNIAGVGYGYALLWTFIFPFASFYLLRSGEGILWCAGMFVVTAAVLLFPETFGAYVYEEPYLLRVLGVYLLLSAMGYFYERIRETLIRGMQEELDEKELLLREIHHRVSNNLSVVQGLLSLQCEASPDESSRSALRESESRVEAISILHETLYSSEPSSSIEMSAYLGKLVTRISATYQGKAPGVQVDLEVPELLMDVDLAMPCALITNELVTNSLKHAFPEGRGRVVVSLGRLEGKGYELGVKDDGIGIPNEMDLSAGGSFGMKMVDAFTEQLGGKMEIKSGIGGTAMLLVFSDKERREDG